jgi:hypothetical protein
MARRVTGRWQKFPTFIEYANDCITFQHKTEATLQRAWQLAVHIFFDPKGLAPGTWLGNLSSRQPIPLIRLGLDISTWTNDAVWEMLATNQKHLQVLLDGMIKGFVRPTYLQWLDQHANHFWMHPSWANIGPGELQSMLLSCFPNPGSQYYEHLQIYDPLDGLYWQLREFLRLGGEQRLRKCPVCKRFFVQSTARPTTYCGRKCRLKSDPRRRKADAEYQKRYRKKLREELIHEKLEIVQEAKALLRASGEENLALGWVLEEAKIDKKLWNSLRRWEEERYGRPRITDLSRP